MSLPDPATFHEWVETVAVSADPDLHLLDRAELIDAWLKVSDLASIAYTAKRKIEHQLALILDTPEVLPNGSVIKATRKVSRTKWRKSDLWEALERRFMGRSLVDPDSGERVWAIDPKRAKAVLDVAIGRTRNLREAGIDIADWCDEQWEDAVEVIK